MSDLEAGIEDIDFEVGYVLVERGYPYFYEMREQPETVAEGTGLVLFMIEKQE